MARREVVVEQSMCSDKPEINDRYHRFNVKLGAGAFKEVYKAFDTHEQIDVAWNSIDLSQINNEDEKRKIFKECEMLKRLNHPNILKITNQWYNEKAEKLCFITNIVHDGSLAKFYKKGKRQVNLYRVKDICKQILGALQYLHQQEVIHRDLKCDNIFIEGNTGKVVLGDLGLSCSIVSARSIVGTPHWMAPETYKENYDEMADIWSFGMCVLELITSRIPYEEHKGPYQLYLNISAGKKPESLSKINSPYVRDFITFCLEPDPKKRPSANELLGHPFLLPKRSDTQLCSELMKPKRKPPPDPEDSKNKSNMNNNNNNTNNNSDDNELSPTNNTKHKPKGDNQHHHIFQVQDGTPGPPLSLYDDTNGHHNTTIGNGNGNGNGNNTRSVSPNKNDTKSNASRRDLHQTRRAGVSIKTVHTIDDETMRIKLQISAPKFNKPLNVEFDFRNNEEKPSDVATEMTKDLKLPSHFTKKVENKIVKAIEEEKDKKTNGNGIAATSTTMGIPTAQQIKVSNTVPTPSKKPSKRVIGVNMIAPSRTLPLSENGSRKTLDADFKLPPDFNCKMPLTEKSGEPSPLSMNGGCTSLVGNSVSMDQSETSLTPDVALVSPQQTVSAMLQPNDGTTAMQQNGMNNHIPNGVNGHSRGPSVNGNGMNGNTSNSPPGAARDPMYGKPPPGHSAVSCHAATSNDYFGFPARSGNDKISKSAPDLSAGTNMVEITTSPLIISPQSQQAQIKMNGNVNGHGNGTGNMNKNVNQINSNNHNGHNQLQTNHAMNAQNKMTSVQSVSAMKPMSRSQTSPVRTSKGHLNGLTIPIPSTQIESNHSFPPVNPSIVGSSSLAMVMDSGSPPLDEEVDYTSSLGTAPMPNSMGGHGNAYHEVLRKLPGPPAPESLQETQSMPSYSAGGGGDRYTAGSQMDMVQKSQTFPYISHTTDALNIPNGHSSYTNLNGYNNHNHTGHNGHYSEPQQLSPMIQQHLGSAPRQRGHSVPQSQSVAHSQGASTTSSGMNLPSTGLEQNGSAHSAISNLESGLPPVPDTKMTKHPSQLGVGGSNTISPKKSTTPPTPPVVIDVDGLSTPDTDANGHVNYKNVHQINGNQQQHVLNQQLQQLHQQQQHQEQHQQHQQHPQQHQHSQPHQQMQRRPLSAVQSNPTPLHSNGFYPENAPMSQPTYSYQHPRSRSTSPGPPRTIDPSHFNPVNPNNVNNVNTNNLTKTRPDSPIFKRPESATSAHSLKSNKSNKTVSPRSAQSHGPGTLRHDRNPNPYAEIVVEEAEQRDDPIVMSEGLLALQSALAQSTPKKAGPEIYRLCLKLTVEELCGEFDRRSKMYQKSQGKNGLARQLATIIGEEIKNDKRKRSGTSSPIHRPPGSAALAPDLHVPVKRKEMTPDSVISTMSTSMPISMDGNHGMNGKAGSVPVQSVQMQMQQQQQQQQMMNVHSVNGHLPNSYFDPPPAQIPLQQQDSGNSAQSHPPSSYHDYNIQHGGINAVNGHYQQHNGAPGPVSHHNGALSNGHAPPIMLQQQQSRTYVNVQIQRQGSQYFSAPNQPYVAVNGGNGMNGQVMPSPNGHHNHHNSYPQNQMSSTNVLMNGHPASHRMIPSDGYSTGTQGTAPTVNGRDAMHYANGHHGHVPNGSDPSITSFSTNDEEGVMVELPPRVSELRLPFDVEELDLPQADSECNFTADQISEINSKTLELHREFFDFVKRKYEIIELRYQSTEEQKDGDARKQEEELLKKSFNKKREDLTEKWNEWLTDRQQIAMLKNKILRKQRSGSRDEVQNMLEKQLMFEHDPEYLSIMNSNLGEDEKREFGERFGKFRHQMMQDYREFYVKTIQEFKEKERKKKMMNGITIPPRYEPTKWDR